MGCVLTMWNLLVLLPQNKQLYDKERYIFKLKNEKLYSYIFNCIVENS
jgi:hypothetical protein